MDDYVPVNERIAAFYEKYPDGSLQSEIVVHTDSLIVMQAKAFRSPADERPGVGTSSIEVPGRTPFTRGSEMENCETSAWGRALAALGFEVKRGIASAEEVQNKQGEPQSAPRRSQTPSAPRSVPQPQEAAPSLNEDDWAGLIEETAPAKKPTPISSGPGLSSRDFFDRTDDAGIDRKVVTATAKKMYGESKWKVTELTDEERLALWQELEPVAA